MKPDTKKMSRPDGFELMLVLLFVAALVFYCIMNYSAGLSSAEVITSTLFAFLPLALSCFSIWLNFKAKWQKTRKGKLSLKTSKLIRWTPRVAGIIIASFIGLFSFDVFGSQGNIFEMLAGFFIHSIPSIVIGIIVFISWDKEQIGFFAFLLISMIFSTVIFRNPEMMIGYILLFIAPMLCISALYWINWKWK